ncbi:MAG: caspase family protein [Nitrospirota bacterium]
MIHRLVLAILLSIVVSNNVSASDKPEIFVQMGHSDNVAAIVFSPDGKYLASGSPDKSVRIWEIDTGREIRTLKLDQPIVGHNSVKFSPDGKFLASAEAEGFIRLWDIFTGKELKKFPIAISEKLEKDEFLTSSAIAIAFSPNGKSLIVAAEIYFHRREASYRKIKSIINLWDIKTGKLNKIIPVHTERISDMALSPDGKYVLLGSGTDNAVIQLDIKTGKEMRRFAGHSKTVHSVAVSPNGEYVASGSEDKTIVMWHIKSGKKIKTFTNPQRYERFSIAFPLDGKRLVVSGLNEMELWDVSTSQVITTLKDDHIYPWAVIFSPDGRHVAFSYSHAIAMWDTSTAIDGGVYHTSEAAAKIYGYSIVKLTKFGGNVEGPGNAYFSSGNEKINVVASSLHEFDRFVGSLHDRKKIWKSYNNCFFEIERDFSRGGIISIVDGKKGGAIIRTGYDVLKDKDMPVFMTFSPDGRYAVGQEHQDGSVTYKIIDIKNKREISTLETPSKFVMDAAAFSPDGRYVAGRNSIGEEPIFTLWNVSTGKAIRTFSGHSHFVNSILFTADGSHILSGSADNTLKLWETATGKEIRTFYGHTSPIDAVNISGDGQYMASGDWGGDIKLWEMNTGREIKTFKGHINWIKTVAFSPDGKSVLSGSRDGTARLWDISTGKEIAQFISFTDGEWIVITPEGYFNASPNGAKHLNVRVGNNVYSIDNFYEKFFNPVYVASVLQGKKIEAVADIRKGILTPPDVKIISPEPNATFSTDTVTITVSAKDTGGGIDEIRLYHNGKAIGEDQRAVKIVPKGNEAVKTYIVTLVDGANTFRATAFSKDRIESNPYELIVKLTAPSKDVSLYVLAVGINKYKNPALNLNYAEPDAKGITGFFRQKGKGLFKKVEIIEIYNEQATKGNIVSKLNRLQATHPQDAVLIYLAGHGENISDKWYFIPHELTYPEREEDVKTKGISSDELSGLIKNIKAQKILLLIDSCKSGAVLIAFRGFEDRKALSQLSRATGVHIVAASTKDQFAAEVKELGHGVFTYILLEGLKGKASGGTETVTVRKLMGYVEERLPDITKKYKQEAQFPVVDSRGMDFPLVIVK